MKLLRTTTTDPSGLFNVFLNQDLKIEPFSKIALGQLASAVRKDVLTIDGTNDTVSFSTKTGATRFIKLNHGDYDNTNKVAFIESLGNKIDAAIGVFQINADDTNKVYIKDGNNIGKSSRIQIGKQEPAANKVVVQIHQSKSWSHYPELTKNIFSVNSVPQLSITGTTEANVRVLSALDTIDESYQRSTFFGHNLCIGVGVFRVRLNNLSGTSATNKGYTIGLSSVNPANFNSGSAGRAFTLDDFEVGISALNPYADGNYGVITNTGGTGSITPAAPAVTPNNAGVGNEKDVASIEICNGRLRLVIYQHDAAAPDFPHTRILHDVPYNPANALYGVIVIHGKSSLIDLKDIKFSGNSFSDQSAPNAVDEDPDYLGKATPPRQITTTTLNSLEWPTLTVSQWFGYEQLLYDNVRGTPNVDFIADTIFKANIENDLYLVEMLNLQLESYDTFEQGRKNILAIVPYDDENAKVAYDPNNLLFLDLNNKETLNISSLKFRLVRADYSAPETIGITTAVLFFKGKDEL